MPLPVTLNHLTIYLNFFDDRVEAVNRLDMTARQSMNFVELDAKELDIIHVKWMDQSNPPPHSDLTFDYVKDVSKLKIILPRTIETGERFSIETFTVCFPSANLLEGIYRDVTPDGAPQQYISQCQQWGFQRIMPIFDDCTAKCTMTTTLEADKAYTHLISNGNIDRNRNPEGKSVPKPGDPSRQIITYENRVPMAPYLFIAAAGTWDELIDKITYPSGHTVRLEYLVPPGRTKDAKIPMDILKASVLWVQRTQGYEYPADTYRTICMTKSNFGGMENVGNTTIVTDAALIDEHTLDQQLMYAHAVIVHEFEHNQCGSETTMETPFDVWLNEAYTVDVERRFMAEMFDPSFVRLGQVDGIRNPLLGPLAIEDGGHASSIVREGFNDPDDLIDGVTYVKAAEVIRMLRLILGETAFEEGKKLYFDRFKDSNANTDDFFRCFEEVCNISLEKFKKSWLYTIGYPEVTASTEYDDIKKQLIISLHQKTRSGIPFHIPLEIAFIDEKGTNIPGSEKIIQFTDESREFSFDMPKEPMIVSLNRGYSFYGTFRTESSDYADLKRRIFYETDLFNRVEAMRQLTDKQRVKLLLNPDEAIDRDWLEIYGEILDNGKLPAALKAYFLRVEEQPMDREYAVWYPELVQAREKLMTAVNDKFKERLIEEFHNIDTYRVPDAPKDGIEERILKNVLLDLIAVNDLPESHDLILGHLASATTAQDVFAALIMLNRSSCSKRYEILEKVYEKSRSHLSAYGNYLKIVSSGTGDDVFDMIRTEKNRPTFDISQPTWSRSLFLPMAGNNKKVWTEQGLEWASNTVIELSAINAFVASRLLNTFQHFKRLRPYLQTRVRPALEKIASHVKREDNPTLFGQVRAYLD